MKIAVLADIHGNLAALEAVTANLDAWGADQVIVNGDIVNRGPRSRECLEFVEERGWTLIRGNHEDYVLRCLHDPHPEDAIERIVYGTAYWTYSTLSKAQLETIDALPLKHVVQHSAAGEGEKPVVITHASERGNAHGIFPWTTENELADMVDTNASFYLVAHTHYPLVRQLRDIAIVNGGAVGLPFDGDTRAAYLRFERRASGWVNECVRLDYDRARAARDFHDSGFLELGGPLSRLVLDELEHAESRLFQWSEQYFTRVINGDIDVDTAVDRFLEA